MPKRSAVETLPSELKAWLDAELLRRGFSDYRQLAVDLEAKGADVSKSSVQRYGSKFELRMAQLKRSTEQARALVDQNPDDEGKLNEAVIRLAQDKIYTLLVEMDINPTDVDANKLFKSAAEIGKASVLQRKTAVELRERIAARASQVADEISREAKTMGASEETIKTWREKVLGVTSA
jgi:AcrR family transcriptional regulator